METTNGVQTNSILTICNDGWMEILNYTLCVCLVACVCDPICICHMHASNQQFSTQKEKNT